jgi:hypothetical protein
LWQRDEWLGLCHGLARANRQTSSLNQCAVVVISTLIRASIRAVTSKLKLGTPPSPRSRPSHHAAGWHRLLTGLCITSLHSFDVQHATRARTTRLIHVGIITTRRPNAGGRPHRIPSPPRALRAPCPFNSQLCMIFNVFRPLLSVMHARRPSRPHLGSRRASSAPRRAGLGRRGNRGRASPPGAHRPMFTPARGVKGPQFSTPPEPTSSAPKPSSGND